jgi:uncharacterized protein (TIGR02145 family)
MNKLKHILIVLLLLNCVTICAQKVSNIAYRQEQSNIIVSYDLDTKTPCKVSLYVSTNGGDTWQGPLTKVTGDVVDKITSGNKSITWNVLEEFDELRGDKIMFQVRAVGDNIKTVIIGTQEWTTKNLNVSKYRNGDIIPEAKDPNIWANLTTGAWCYYNNDPENGVIYGKLYNWYAVNDPRGLAPEGYHIPSLSKWSNLIDNLGGAQIAGGKMKELTTKNWKYPNKEANNSSGFNGLPGGRRYGNGEFDNIGYGGFWWSSSEYDTSNAWYHYLSCNYGDAFRNGFNKSYGFSVRCLRD